MYITVFVFDEVSSYVHKLSALTVQCSGIQNFNSTVLTVT